MKTETLGTAGHIELQAGHSGLALPLVIHIWVLVNHAGNVMFMEVWLIVALTGASATSALPRGRGVMTPVVADHGLPVSEIG
jgi:hypothetical protein